MRKSGIESGVSAALVLAASLGCGKAGVSDAHFTEGTLPQAPAARGAGAVDYPAEPGAPPPVPPPAGQGLGVKLERYIAIDQFGYRPDMTKVAVLVNPQLGWNAADEHAFPDSLEVRRWSDGTVASTGRVTPWNEGQLDQSSGDRGAWFNFTSLTEPGLYYVYDARRQVRSHPFEIGDDVYAKVLKTAFRMFYFNRADFEKKSPFACQGEKCWPQGADPSSSGGDAGARSVTERDNGKTARDLRGGWWDAGDPSKDVTSSNDAVHQLLTAYREHPSAFTDDFGIPESGNGVPDLLDELLVELTWLQKMQPDDLEGGVLLAVGSVEPSDSVPDESKLSRYYYPEPCSAATITVAGELAHAAVVLRQLPQFKGEAHDLLQRAERAWQHYHQHPKSDACDDGSIKAGDADRSLEEQEQTAVTAAVYLFDATGKAEYGEYVTEHYTKTEPWKSDQWSLYRPSQGDALLHYAQLERADPSTARLITQRKTTQADSIDIYRWRPKFDLYRAFMRPSTYQLGSNQQRAAIGNTNYDLIARELVKGPQDRKSLVDRAAGMLHSFHGVNPMQLVYLTNMYAVGGDACADEMYHHWFRDKHPKWDNARTSELGPAPGYVTGGPNKSYCEGQPAEHACTRSPVRAQPPGKAYVDTNTGWEPESAYDKAWELTEPTVALQASYVRLISKFVN